MPRKKTKYFLLLQKEIFNPLLKQYKTYAELLKRMPYYREILYGTTLRKFSTVSEIRWRGGHERILSKCSKAF